MSEHQSFSSESTTKKVVSLQLSITQENTTKISRHFSALSSQTCSKLQQKGVDIDDLRFFLSHMIDQGKPAQVLDTITSVREMFYALSKDKKIWNFMNYHLLDAIIQEFASNDKELISGMRKYRNDLAGFQISTELSTYLEMKEHLEPDEGKDLGLTEELFSQLQVKLKVNVNEQSLRYVEELWASLREVFALPSYSLLLGEMVKNCLRINFYFPSSQADQISHQVCRCDAFFRKHSIVEVRINGIQLYSSEEDHNVSWYVYTLCELTVLTPLISLQLSHSGVSSTRDIPMATADPFQDQQLRQQHHKQFHKPQKQQKQLRRQRNKSAKLRRRKKQWQRKQHYRQRQHYLLRKRRQEPPRGWLLGFQEVHVNHV